MASRFGRAVSLAFMLLCAVTMACAENPAPFTPAGLTPASLTAAQIVAQIQQRDQARIREFKQYTSLRHYAVEYHGFAAKIDAQMDVEATYSAATGKSFRIVSQSGSKVLCEKVLKRALDSEKEASQDKAATALNEKNYRFQLVGTDTVAGRPAYVLHVDPLTQSKFLYRGKIWVDAEDFAVARMETEPAKNPSFWISHVSIQTTSAKVGSFWLTAHLRSETKVRVGGTAVFTVDYGTYTVVSQPASRASAD